MHNFVLTDSKMLLNTCNGFLTDWQNSKQIMEILYQICLIIKFATDLFVNHAETIRKSLTKQTNGNFQYCHLHKKI